MSPALSWLVILGAWVALTAFYSALVLLVGLTMKALDRECGPPRMYRGTALLK
jgi:hypothetical protein